MWNRGVMKEYGVHYSYLSEAGNLVLQRPSGVCCTIKGITKYSCLLEMEPTSQRHTLHEMHSALTPQIVYFLGKPGGYPTFSYSDICFEFSISDRFGWILLYKHMMEK